MSGEGINFLAITQALETMASATGQFVAVLRHDVRSAPADNGIVGYITGNSIDPIQTSGMASTSLRLEIIFRCLLNGTAEPQSLLDFGLFGAAAAMMQAITLSPRLGITDGTIRTVDLLGSDGEPLRMAAGWVDIGGTQFRMADVFIPILINDAFDQG